MSTSNVSESGYSDFDHPEITSFLFHPRPEYEESGSNGGFESFLIPVEDSVSIGARFYFAGKERPTILFFHGNGEIVADYDDIARIYTQIGVNFLPVDYRGYGRSNGTPSVLSMMRDCLRIFDHVENWLRENDHTGPIIVMGRSLGSASALELAANRKNSIEGLIIESGFAFFVPLLRLLGVDAEALGFREESVIGNHKKIQLFDKPTLIIHAERDDIIPLKEGKCLYDNSPDPDKTLLVIPLANHNNIFAIGIESYMESIKEFINRIN